MKILTRTEEAFIGISLLAVTTVLFVNIILRYFFNASTTWAEEFTRYAMIWITFVGGSVAFKRGIHVGIDLLIDFLPKDKKKYLEGFIHVLTIILLIFLIKFGMDLVLFTMKSGQITASLRLKTYWVHLAVPVGSFLSLIHVVINFVGMFRREKTV